MKPVERWLAIAITGIACAFGASFVFAQEGTATSGSPGATTTINGRQLPPPDPRFGGVIKEKATESKPWWPPRVVPPKGAPNVLLIMTDDAGFGAPGTFGGVVPTPALDRIAKAGLRYANFHSTSLCSPTRAALITGRNHHVAGFGVVGEMATGFPGYDSARARHVYLQRRRRCVSRRSGLRRRRDRCSPLAGGRPSLGAGGAAGAGVVDVNEGRGRVVHARARDVPPRRRVRV